MSGAVGLRADEELNEEELIKQFSPSRLPKFFICSNRKQFLTRPGYENYLLVQPGERVALNPKYVMRIHELVQAYANKIILVSRSKVVSTILESTGYPFEVLYV